MKEKNFKRTKLACYSAYFTMSSIFSLPPLLFATLQDMYGISYTLLGTLVLTNFCTQLTVDLIFTVFSKHFNIGKVVKVMPLITSAGMFIYALSPTLLPQNTYLGLLIGTVLFSVSAGLSEVLLSPVIAAIPSDNPQKDMSLLHSLFGIGVFSVVIFSALFLRIFGTQHWNILMFILAALPILSAVLFMISPIPDMSGEADTSAKTEGSRKRTVGLFLCILCIFFGSCAENSMSIWLSLC
jgi:fucose permease